MRVLLTNDDGIEGIGLRLLASWARKLGQITVVAPSEEKSACSQSIVLRRPFAFRKSHVLSDLGIEAYTADATPADCVRIAAAKLGHFDLVLSGINAGYNTGHFIAYSGTCAAIFEAAYQNMPAIGFSAHSKTIQEAAEELDRIWDFFTANRLLDQCSIFNVNIPERFSDFRITRQEEAFCHDVFLDEGDERFLAKLDLTEWEARKKDLNDDMDAFFAGYCSITPLKTDRTDTAVFENLKVLNKD